MMNAKKSPAKHLYKYAFVLPVVLATIFLTHPLGGQPLQEQEKDVAVVKQEFTLTQQQLKAFEGYYQFEKNPEAHLQFTVKEKGLVAKQVWDGKEFFIVPKSALEFSSQKEEYPAKFTKDENGTVTQVLVFNQDVWKKVKNYTPRTEVKLSPQKLKTFEGKYTFQFEKGKDEFLEISAKEDHLMVKELWTGKEMKFVPTSELEFYHKERMFPLKFTKSGNGSVTHVLAFNKDLWTNVKEKKSE